MIQEPSIDGFRCTCIRFYIIYSFGFFDWDSIGADRYFGTAIDRPVIRVVRRKEGGWRFGGVSDQVCVEFVSGFFFDDRHRACMIHSIRVRKIYSELVMKPVVLYVICTVYTVLMLSCVDCCVP